MVGDEGEMNEKGEGWGRATIVRVMLPWGLIAEELLERYRLLIK